MIYTTRSDTRVKKSPRELAEKGIVSNKQQLAIYLKSPEEIEAFLRVFNDEKYDVEAERPRHFYFVDCLQARIINEMLRGRNYDLLIRIIPHMKFTGKSLERFIKSAPRDLVILYYQFNYIPRKNRNLLATRLG